MYENADPNPRGAIELVGPIIGDTIHYWYLDSAGRRLPGQHSYSLTSRTFD
jgi:hypothetical protein